MKPRISAIALFILMATTQMSSATVSNPDDSNNTPIGEINAAKVNIKAVRDFTRFYRNINYAKWFTTAKGYSANFDLDGKNIKVVYDVNGNRLYSIISYTEKLLDTAIRDLVKTKYYDYSIIGVHQFEFENKKTVYVIKMTDTQSKAITLKVYEGQTEVIN